MICRWCVRFALAVSLFWPMALCAQEAETIMARTIVFDSAEQFDAMYRDQFIDVKTRPGVVLLAPVEYITHEVGNKIAKTSVQGEMIARKVFALDTLGASRADVYVFGAPGQASFNGTAVTFQRMPFGGWTYAEIDGSLLRQGSNELDLRNVSISHDRETRPAKFSFISADGGRSWRRSDGEFVVRLRLFRHPPQGVITSEPVDLAEPDGRDIVRPLVQVVRVALKADADLPPGTGIVLEGRTGPSPVPDASWSNWTPADALRPARFLQWRATLRTTDRTKSPALKAVGIKAHMTMVADPAAQGIAVKSADNPKVIRSSWPFTFQVPSKKLATLRQRWQLDRIIEPGQTEMDQFILLRNWVRRQWPHNDAGSGVRTWDAIEILSAPEGQHGMCVHYGVAYTQCALSLGFNSRQIILSGHYVSDIWSNAYRKWVLMDVECVQKEGWDRYGTALYWDSRNDVPMSSLDLHRALMENRVQDIVQMFYMTDEAGQHKLYERRYGPEEYGNFRRFAYPPRNNYLDQLEPWEEFHGQDHYHADSHLWWQDTALAISPEFSWHTNREGDINWTVNVVHAILTATREPDTLHVTLDTVTPHLKEFQYRINGSAMQSVKGEGNDPHSRRAYLSWKLQPGENRLLVRPMNTFGRPGVQSTIVVTRE